jgi:hypothetical protein
MLGVMRTAEKGIESDFGKRSFVGDHRAVGKALLM